MPRSVLVPVDGSNFAEHALPYALGIVRRTGGTLHLALVHVPADMVGPNHPLADRVEARRAEQQGFDEAYVEELTKRIGASGMVVRPALLRGNVAAALSRYAEQEQVGLVVMTTHGRGGFQRAWLGSTADTLVRHCMAPILLIRPSDHTREIDAAVDLHFQRVVAALDGSETAELALREALDSGVADDGSLVLAHVLQPPVAASSPYLPHTIQLAHEEIHIREARMREYLERVAAQDWLAGRAVEVRVVADYKPAPAILDVATELDADLIVLGTHGRGGFRRLILGSVADKVIRGTRRAVFVHRGEGRVVAPTAADARPEASEPTRAGALR